MDLGTHLAYLYVHMSKKFFFILSFLFVYNMTSGLPEVSKLAEVSSMLSAMDLSAEISANEEEEAKPASAGPTTTTTTTTTTTILFFGEPTAEQLAGDDDFVRRIVWPPYKWHNSWHIQTEWFGDVHQGRSYPEPLEPFLKNEEIFKYVGVNLPNSSQQFQRWFRRYKNNNNNNNSNNDRRQ